jgi:hypothetical protein
MTGPFIIGLPGLYQNWLISALDPDSKFQLTSQHNFECTRSRCTWIKKNDIDFVTAEFPNSTVNTYVCDENFVWYLYNFFEKTNGVEIYIDSFLEHIESKAIGTVAFNFLFNHLYKHYNFADYTNHEYRTNSAIEYFYFLLLDTKNKFKTQSRFTHPQFVNIEYLDFENSTILKNKLSHLELFDSTYFDHMYSLLHQRNLKYLSMRKNFINKVLANDRKFDILETAYIGKLLTTGEPLDWFNSQLREDNINNQWAKICNLVSNLL